MLCSVLFIVIFAVSTISLSYSQSAPDFVQPCAELTPECLKESIQKAVPGFVKGIPELGIDSLDPFLIDNLQLSLPGGLKMIFNKGVSKGFDKCIIDSSRFVKDTLELKLHCDLTVNGKYKSSGRLLLFPINGEGDSTIKCRNINVLLAIKFGTKMEQDGKRHLEIKQYMTKHSFDGRVTYHITNLFQGNPEISKLVLEFMNSNWRLVAEEFGTPIVDFGVKTVMKNIKKFFKAVPLDELIKARIDF